ncbi:MULTISPECIES: hypothetical protein [Legionella]|uniref:Uncharacterized protein n=1 Tax=Legionella maceachernii TaxID=466 RepID=A0A0W0W026_9GAMM|nr:hypothetical protein [Legionella maceachernii]KTD25617.1 hypothetical protein Lmac_1981 [Legionella maceachernii]SJZ57647.1 hypothetical protein SAMN02745128_00472 [Legionella maceachernii]SUP00645.1 Uncharacterised protein [Legionella maceachernii]
MLILRQLNRPVHRKAPLRLYHNREQIIDAAILTTHSKKGKGPSSKHFIVINGIKTEVFNKNQLKRRQLLSQQPEEEERGVKRARLQITVKESALTEYYDHLAELEGFSTNQSIDALPQVWQTQLTPEAAQSDESVNHVCLQTTGQRSALTSSYDRILAELEDGLSSTQSTDALPEVRQTRLTQDVAQANSLDWVHALSTPKSARKP